MHLGDEESQRLLTFQFIFIQNISYYMDNPEHMWHPNWSERLQDKVRTTGFRNLGDLLARMPAQPYESVAQLLGTNVAPIQIVSLQFEEARAGNALRHAAIDCLCRNLCEQLPLGWGRGENSDFRNGLALSSWITEIEVTGKCPHLAPRLLAIAKDIRASSPPDGWKPVDTADPLINAVFAKHWPSEST